MNIKSESCLLLTRKEAAERMNWSLPTLDEYLKREHFPIPSLRAGRKVLIPFDALCRWIECETERQMSNGAVV